MTKRRWLITGCSSGMGRALAEHLAIAGEDVLATARDVTTLAALTGPGVLTATLDVRDEAQCAAAVRLAVERFGGVDVLVNNAGYGQFGTVEEITDAELEAQFDTNVYGPWRLMRHVLPVWREQGSGHAIFSSSVSASHAFPGLSAYTASKFALEGLAEAVAAETAPFGVRTTILQLGMFATGYGDKLRLPAHRIEAYQPLVAGMLDGARAMGASTQASPPELFAETVRRIVDMPAPPLRIAFGSTALDLVDSALATRRNDLEAARRHHVPA
ncbi:SDR family oxidoreductase [Actinoplanes sp. NPDC051494]|uniref:SDR family oxidoreductase n=1 Tax=Actinoplanes sp. NPDC051494 TaxID=3363907 RepID=UPI0037A30486